ncbi:MAG: tRNA dihydrouridine synthase DusB [Clostridia bacterium]|nr:tRNA dihydrouridine synthase DusB [Clostridia bacterium]
MKIGNIEFKNNLILAPMAGVTDVAFRSICISCGADAAVGELISAKALVYQNKKTQEMLVTAPNEKIKIVQLFGSEPEIMAKAVKLPILKKFDIIDINMGCPAPKIVNNGEGSALMNNINLAEQIIRACVNATNKPVTVKFRLGWDEKHINCVEFARMCERAGASAITIHGRTRNMFYSGKADWDMIAKVKNAVSIPVIANGDVCDIDSYNSILSKTNCDAVMIGRATLGNPQVFADIVGGKKHTKMYYIKRHVKLLRKYYPERFIVAHMRKHFLWYLKGVKGGAEIKAKVSVSDDVDNSIKLMQTILK